MGTRNQEPPRAAPAPSHPPPAHRFRPSCRTDSTERGRRRWVAARPKGTWTPATAPAHPFRARRTVTCPSWCAGWTNCSRRPSRPRPPPGPAMSCWSTPPSGWAGTPSPCCPRIPGCGSSASTATRRRCGSPSAGWQTAGLTDRVELVHAVYDRIGEVITERVGVRPGAGRPVRPRGLLGPAGRVRPRLRLRAGRPAGHADGPDDRHHRRRRGQHLPRRRTDPDPAGVRRRAVRRPDLQGAGRRAGPAAVHHQRPAGRTRPRPPSPPPPGAPAATPPSARSRRCGSRSTTSWVPCGGRFRLPCSISRWPAGSW